MKSLHISLVVREFPKTSETFILNHARGLAARGHRVSVLGWRSSGHMSQGELSGLYGYGVKVYYLRPSKGGILQEVVRGVEMLVNSPSLFKFLRRPAPFEYFYAAFVHKTLRRLDPDIVHVHFGTCARALQAVGLHRRVVVTWHGYDANRVPREQGEVMYHDLFQAPWTHTVGSGFMRDRLIGLGANHAQVSRNPMGVELSRFTFKQREYNENRPLRLVSVGRLSEEKGHLYLIQAVSDLLKAGVPLQLRIIGDGPLHEKLKTLVSERQQQHAIHLLGRRTSEQVIEEMHGADLFCSTGVVARDGAEEGQGLVFAEAQATGLPVIASAVGGVPESLIDGQTGLLCRPRNVAAIKRSIQFFMEHPDEIRRFGERGRAFIEANFSLEEMLDNFEEIYQSMIDD